MREMEAKACEHARERDGACAVLVPGSVTWRAQLGAAQVEDGPWTGCSVFVWLCL